jgi:hypothetical protein
MQKFDNQYYSPQQDANAGGRRGYVLNNFDLMILMGFDEIAQGLNGAVEHLGDQYTRAVAAMICRKSTHCRNKKQMVRVISEMQTL